MGEVLGALRRAREEDAELRGLHAALGGDPARAPPSLAAISRARARVAAEFAHPASPWLYALVGKLRELGEDPDHFLEEWLRDGAPAGIAKEIPPWAFVSPSSLGALGDS